MTDIKRMQRLQASYLEQAHREYCIETALTLNCGNTAQHKTEPLKISSKVLKSLDRYKTSNKITDRTCLESELRFDYNFDANIWKISPLNIFGTLPLHYSAKYNVVITRNEVYT